MPNPILGAQVAGAVWHAVQGTPLCLLGATSAGDATGWWTGALPAVSPLELDGAFARFGSFHVVRRGIHTPLTVGVISMIA